MAAEIEWDVPRECWVASFDILGFKKLADVGGDSWRADLLADIYADVIEDLESATNSYRPGDITYLCLSDTFVIYSTEDTAHSYKIIQQACKRFITNCLYKSTPIRGALSVGNFIKTKDGRAVIGNAFIDAHVYCEDQDWIGFLLTPKAAEKARTYGLNPTAHDFVIYDKIPMRKLKCSKEQVMAFRFNYGKKPLLRMLHSMRSKSGIKHRAKYTRTINFIEKYSRQI